MANRKIDVSQLQAVVDSYLNDYTQETEDAMKAASKEVAKDVVKELRKGGSYNTKEIGTAFNRGWRSKEEDGRMKITTTVYNAKYPNLAHLLEFGHAKRNGGRTRAFNFIAPVADSVEKKFEAAFEKALNKG